MNKQINITTTHNSDFYVHNYNIESKNLTHVLQELFNAYYDSENSYLNLAVPDWADTDAFCGLSGKQEEISRSLEAQFGRVILNMLFQCAFNNKDMTITLNSTCTNDIEVL